MAVEVIPAILVKNREQLLSHISRVKGLVSTVHIDVMDGKFVPNSTVGPADFVGLPTGVSYEFHWMVKDPEEYIKHVRGPHLHMVHVEAIRNWNAIKIVCKNSGGTLGIVINPGTAIERLAPFMKDVSRVLVMSVNPGFSGQSYIQTVEDKIRSLRKLFPNLEIEVDGGINPETAERASAAGADKIAAASAIYAAPDTGVAIAELKKRGESGKKHHGG